MGHISFCFVFSIYEDSEQNTPFLAKMKQFHMEANYFLNFFFLNNEDLNIELVLDACK